jgi:hypothetical protein
MLCCNEYICIINRLKEIVLEKGLFWCRFKLLIQEEMGIDIVVGIGAIEVDMVVVAISVRVSVHIYYNLCVFPCFGVWRNATTML